MVLRLCCLFVCLWFSPVLSVYWSVLGLLSVDVVLSFVDYGVIVVDYVLMLY